MEIHFIPDLRIFQRERKEQKKEKEREDRHREKERKRERRRTITHTCVGFGWQMIELTRKVKGYPSVSHFQMFHP